MYENLIFKRKILLWMGGLFFSFSTFAQSPNQPYNVVMNIYDDPKTTMAFNWFTNNATGCGKVQIVMSETTNPNAFTNPFKEVNADCTDNDTVNKAVVTGLSPNTTYSFRVGGVNNNWSSIGTFTTAKVNKDPFSFMYTTDPQATTQEEFEIASITSHEAFAKYPNANFWMLCGDMVENNVVNQWKQFFATQQDLFLKISFAPVAGNHDNDLGANNINFIRNFNTKKNNTIDNTGSTYSFIYGDAQFFALNGEKYNDITYINDVKSWMGNEIATHSDIKWRIVYYHKTIYTGGSHQDDPSDRIWRDAMAPLFDELNIDLAIQGHNHVYEVIGPVYDRDTVPGAVSSVNSVTYNYPKNVTAKSGGIFNVSKGTLYFVNGASGHGRKNPKLLTDMTGNNVDDIPDYSSLFTGMLAQPGYPTYSHVAVSFDTIIISTYGIDNGNSVLLDEIKVVKPVCEPYTQAKIIYNSNQSFTNKTLIIGEELRITNNATVTFTNSTLRFYKDAKVIIDPGSKLIIDSTTLKNSCPYKLWQGIFVGGNANLPQTPQNQGVLELKNEAVIENARTAISTYTLDAIGNINYATAGGIVKADSATFLDNLNTADFIPYPPIGSSTIRQNIGFFKNCSFTVDSANLFASNNCDFSSHIKLWGVTGVMIKNCKFNNNITSMTNRGRAIYTIDAGYFVSDDCSNLNLLQCTCTGVSQPSVFKGFNKAIESTNSTKQFTISIDRCKFENNITGISLTAKNSFRIIDANMSIGNSYSAYPAGIYLNNCTGYRVDDNHIYSNVNGYFNVPRKEPSIRTNVIALDNATSNPCIKTECAEQIFPGEDEEEEEPGIDPRSTQLSLEEYRRLNLLFSEMMSYFYSMDYDQILTNYYNGILEYSELVREAMNYHEAILSVTEEMAEIGKKALFKLKTNTIIDLTKIRDWYDEIYTLSAKYSLAETYYQLGAYEEGFTTLALIPEKYNLTENEIIEHNNYVALFTFKNNIRESGRTIAELNEAEIGQLITLSEASQGLSSVMAQGILCFFYDICVEEELRLRSVTEGDDEMMRGLDDEMMNIPLQVLEGCPKGGVVERGSLLENITITPNPTTGKLAISPAGGGKGVEQLTINSVEIFDIYGKCHLSHVTRPSSHVTLNISHLSAGLYFVKIVTEQGEIVKKVVKQ